MIRKDYYFLPLSFAIDCIQTLKEKVLGEEFVTTIQKVFGRQKPMQMSLNHVMQFKNVHMLFSAFKTVDFTSTTEKNVHYFLRNSTLSKNISYSRPCGPLW